MQMLDGVFRDIEKYSAERSSFGDFLRTELHYVHGSWIEHLHASFPNLFAIASLDLESTNALLATADTSRPKVARDDWEGRIGDYVIVVSCTATKSLQQSPKLFSSAQPNLFCFGYSFEVTLRNESNSKSTRLSIKATYTHIERDKYPTQFKVEVGLSDMDEAVDKLATIEVKSARIGADFDDRWKDINWKREAIYTFSITDQWTHFHSAIGPAKKTVTGHFDTHFEKPANGDVVFSALRLSGGLEEVEEWWFRGTYYRNYDAWLRAAKDKLTMKELTYLKLNGYDLNKKEETDEFY